MSDYEKAIRFDDAARDARHERRDWVSITRSRKLPDGFDISRGRPGDSVTMTVSRAELAELAAKAAHTIATT